MLPKEINKRKKHINVTCINGAILTQNQKKKLNKKKVSIITRNKKQKTET